jgi:hypothetical protein
MGRSQYRHYMRLLEHAESASTQYNRSNRLLGLTTVGQLGFNDYRTVLVEIEENVVGFDI